MKTTHPGLAGPPGRPSGAALMVVMLLVLAMAVVAGAFAYAMKVETILSMRTQSNAELDWLGRSGVEYAKWILDTQRRIPGENTFDALNQFWAGGPGPTNTIDNPFLEASLDNIPVGEGLVSLRITDAERRMNINNLNQNQLELVLQLVGVPGGEAKMMTEAVLDWRDRDDFDRGTAPSEGPTYYLNLDPPYRAKNGALDDISELLLIRGFTPEIYWGSGRMEGMAVRRSMTPAGSMGRGGVPSRPAGLPESVGLDEGLVELLCAVSNGRVNVNTAGLGVLRAVFAGDEVIPTQILQRRQGPDGMDGTLDDMPFRSVAELGVLGGGGVGGAPGAPAAAGQGLLVTQSSTFEIEVLAQLGRSQRTYRAVVRRGGSREIQVMVFHPQ